MWYIFMHDKVQVISALKMFQYSMNSDKCSEKTLRPLLFICSSLVLSLYSSWRKTLTVSCKVLLQLPFIFFQFECYFDTLIYLRGYQVYQQIKNMPQICNIYLYVFYNILGFIREHNL